MAEKLVIPPASPDWAGTGHSLSELEEMPAWKADDVLIRTLTALQPEAERLNRCIKAIEALLLQRISERPGATEAAGEKMRAVKVPGSNKWTYNLETLAELQNHVPPGQFDEAMPIVPETRNPNKTKLNALARRGGEIKRIIDNGCIEVPGNPKIEIRSL